MCTSFNPLQPISNYSMIYALALIRIYSAITYIYGFYYDSKYKHSLFP
jgi:hypothetical protein